MEGLRFPKLDYYLGESDPDIVVLRRQDDSFVATFPACRVLRESILEVLRRIVGS